MFRRLFVLPLVLCSALVFAQQFAPHVDYPTGKNARTLTTADFNHDGNVDLAVVNSDDNTVSIFIGNGDGTFQRQVAYPTAYGPFAVAAGDFNRDGAVDLVITNYGFVGGNTASVLLGNGDGTFQPHVDFTTGFTPFSVAVADLNADGKLDFVTANYSSGGISVLLGRGDGTFRPHRDYVTGIATASVIIRDFNRDGKPDVAVANSGIVCCAARVGGITVLLGNGDGTFSSKTNYAAGNEPYSLAAADFNHDGALDLVGVQFGGLGNAVSLLLGNGDGTFQAPSQWRVGTESISVATGDLNGDRNPDMVIANGSRTVSVLLGNGDGTFQSNTEYATGGQTDWVAIADLNHDGAPDLITANGNNYTISVLLNTGLVQ